MILQSPAARSNIDNIKAQFFTINDSDDKWILPKSMSVSPDTSKIVVDCGPVTEKELPTQVVTQIGS